MEITKPLGAIAKPQESSLKTFVENTKGLEPQVILSILFFILADDDIDWKTQVVRLSEIALRH